MSLELKFRIEFASDYHIGAGHGLGAGVDSALLRDADGAPVIRGTTLNGILRDSLFRMLQLDPMKKLRTCGESGLAPSDSTQRFCGQQTTGAGLSSCPICRLMGTPRAPKRWSVGSARPDTHKKPGTAKRGRHLSLVAQRARISPRTRRAEPKKLFSREEHGKDKAFIFSITCGENDESALDEAALWTAVARFARELGNSRNRGGGQCLIHLDAVEGAGFEKENWQDYFLERFREKWLDGNCPAQRDGHAAKAEYSDPETQNSEKPEPFRVRVAMRCEEPLMLSGRAVAGNQFDTLPIIEGRSLRGALAWLAASRWDLGPDKQAFIPFLETFLRGDVRFGNLIPAKYHRECLIPAMARPMDLFTCKMAPGKPDAGHGTWFAAEGRLPGDGRCPTCKKPLAAAHFWEFVTLNETSWLKNQDFALNPGRWLEMHVRVDPETRRAAEGQLFGYAALEAGQYFMGELTCQGQGAWDRLAALAGIEMNKPATLYFGRARNRGHGRVTAWFEKIPSDDALQTPPPINQRVGTDTSPIMTLLSDTIMVDRWGRYMTGFEEKWLSDTLGVKVNRILHASAGTRNIGGFNAKLGLPRWNEIALAAGSSARVELASPADLTRLEKLETEGIGLRRNEGFGKVAFNHPVYSQCEQMTAELVLEESMEKPKRYSDSMAKNEKKWAEKLDKIDRSLFTDPRFDAVARWLHGSASSDPNELKERINKIGAPDEMLTDEIKDYPEHDFRQDKNWLNDSRKERDDIIEMLSDLIQERDERFWPTGIRMLADRIASATDRKEQ